MQSKLVIDAMGAFSPISLQSRKGAKPDTAVMLVGSCAEGVVAGNGGDVLYGVEGLDKARGVGPMPC